MAFLGNLLKRFSKFKDAAAEARKRMNPFVQTSVDPMLSWENVSEIGDGAFGKVHRAVSKNDGREAALKQILLESEEDMEDLMVEIDILVSCRHENIVELYEAYHHDNRLWLYLEFCAGGALDTIMHELDRPLSELQIRHVGYYVVQALAFLHSKFVIHRDLKAGNVLIAADGSVKLADFGVSARNTEDKQRRDTFIGTPFWMAPEVIICETMKDNPYDYRADVWSLGITLIELAEMNPPLHEMHPMRVMIKVQRADPPKLRNPKKWSAQFSAFLSRCLVKDPSQRARSCDLLEDVFIREMTDKKPIRQLVGELSAEVIETIEEGVNMNALNQSSISLGSLDRLDEKEDDRASRCSWLNHSPQMLHDAGKRLSLPSTPTRTGLSGDILGASISLPSGSVEYDKVSALEPSDHQKIVNEKPQAKQEASNEKPQAKQEAPNETPQAKQEASNEKPQAKQEAPNEKPQAKQEAPNEKPQAKQEASTPIILTRRQGAMQVVGSGAELDSDCQAPPSSPGPKKRPLVAPKPSLSLIRSSSSPGIIPSVDVRKQVASFENRTQNRSHSPTPRQAGSAKSNSPAVSVVVPPPAPPVEDSVLSEEVFQSLLEEVLESVTDVPSVASVVLDVMNDEMQALMQQEEEQEVAVVTTDIDTIIVADNRTHDPEPQPQIPNGKATPVRVGSGFGTVSAVVSPSTDDNQNLVVRDNRSEGKEEVESSTSGSAASASAKEESNEKVARRRQSHFRTLTRVRKFVVDGEEVTTTTSRVVVEGKETQHEEEYVNRKQGIREMRLLQKQEQRQHRDLVLRSQMQKDELDVRLRLEETNLQRQYEADLEALQRQQKVQLERAEVEHTNEIRFSSRRIKTTQEREIRSFRDLLKQELKGVKQGLDFYPKDQRKERLKQRMEEKDLEHVEREREFQSKLAAQMSAEIDRMTVKHRRKLGQLENGFLRSRHKLRRRFEETRWELEEVQMHLRHQKAREQLEEYFSLKRTQTAHRQGVEKEHLAAMLTKEKEFTLAAQAAEKKRFPKQLRLDRKARMQMFRQSLRVPGVNLSSDEEKEKIRTFEEQETERVRFETERLMKKQSTKLAAMNLTHETMQRELEQLQAEKTKELMDQETGKLREIDEAFRKNLTQYRENLKERRQNLETELQEELRKQEEFYTQSDDGPNVQIRELSDGTSPVTDLDRMPFR